MNKANKKINDWNEITQKYKPENMFLDEASILVNY